MTPPPPRLVYLAQPIDQVIDSFGLGELGDLLAAARISAFRPARGYTLGLDAGPDTRLAVDAINMLAFARCDAVIAVLPAGAPTLGTPVEIERALGLDKPTVIFTSLEIERRSVQIESWRQVGATVYTFGDLPTPDELLLALRGGRSAAEGMWLKGATPDLPFTIINPRAARPTRAYPDDAGLDLASTEQVKIEPGDSARIPTGLAFAIPSGYWGMITGRSSTWHSRGLLTIQAVIDPGWRGELFVSVYNPGNEPVVVDAGDRVGQLVLLPSFGGAPVYTAELPPHERGTNGFGSSGR